MPTSSRIQNCSNSCWDSCIFGYQPQSRPLEVDGRAVEARNDAESYERSRNIKPDIWLFTGNVVLGAFKNLDK